MSATNYWGHDFGHYSRPHCGGTMSKSGKGGGPRLHDQRHQSVLAFPAWGGKNGTDVYFSSRWDNQWQIFDHFHSPKKMPVWWQTKTWEYVFIQEVPFDLRSQEFVWDDAVDCPPPKTLAKIRRRQRNKFFEGASYVRELRQ